MVSEINAAFGDAPNVPTFFCPAEQLRVARCDRKGSDASQQAPKLVISVEQMLVCQDKDKNFSLRARYLEAQSETIKETAPIPATPTRLKDSSVSYATNVGLNLVLSADRQQAVIQQCKTLNSQGQARAKDALPDCQDSLAICK